MKLSVREYGLLEAMIWNYQQEANTFTQFSKNPYESNLDLERVKILKKLRNSVTVDHPDF